MANIHTIKINEERRGQSSVTSTRRSESRRYHACIVATVTEATARIARAKVATLSAELASLAEQERALQEKHGCDADAADAIHKPLVHRWFSGEGGLFDTVKRVAENRGLSRFGDQAKLDELAKADMISRGFVDPFDPESSYGLIQVSDTIRAKKWLLSQQESLKLGSEIVLSWHGSPALAQKALNSHDWYRARGDKLAVRTDIEVRVTKKRGAKA